MLSQRGINSNLKILKTHSFDPVEYDVSKLLGVTSTPNSS